MSGDGQRSGVVVCGIDDSAAARHALSEAVRIAARRGDRLRVVTAYEPPETWGAWTCSLAAASPMPGDDGIHALEEAAARAVVAQVVAELRGEVEPMPEIEVEARSGRAGDVLPACAHGADALVIGHRGRGALASRLLGSVGLGLVLHAPCVVTLVPAPARAETPFGGR
jgi:nucleotide-binding universal stress UspA family protein